MIRQQNFLCSIICKLTLPYSYDILSQIISQSNTIYFILCLIFKYCHYHRSNYMFNIFNGNTEILLFNWTVSVCMILTIKYWYGNIHQMNLNKIVFLSHAPITRSIPKYLRHFGKIFYLNLSSFDVSFKMLRVNYSTPSFRQFILTIFINNKFSFWFA